MREQVDLVVWSAVCTKIESARTNYYRAHIKSTSSVISPDGLSLLLTLLDHCPKNLIHTAALYVEKSEL
jgi:hypothetical protein